MTIRQMLDRKGHDVWSVDSEATVFDALRLMADKNIGTVVVLKAGELVGIFSERDYARKIIVLKRPSKEVTVRALMTARVVCVRPEQTADDCMALMTDKRVRYLPVLEEDRVIGMVSIGDVVRELISEHQFTIEQLENYISSAD